MSGTPYMAYGTKTRQDALDNALRSAGLVVPKIIDLFPGAKTIFDAGPSGGGIWLREFELAGLEAAGCYFGIPALEPVVLQTYFSRADLSGSAGAGGAAGKKYDLAFSFDAAQHIPGEYADALVSHLVNVSGTVLFCAALPGQESREPLNEQWPSFWIEKFAARSFECLDVLRPLFWYEGRIEAGIRQNLMLFTKDKKTMSRFSGAEKFCAHPVIHPAFFLESRASYIELQKAYNEALVSWTYRTGLLFLWLPRKIFFLLKRLKWQVKYIVRRIQGRN